MKKYFKGLLFRISIFIIVVIFIFTFIDKFIFYSDYSVQWTYEDKLINRMNHEKLKNNSWDAETLIWKYKNDGYLPAKGDKKRILIVGDSVTWGHGFSNMNHLWWKQLENMLYLNGYSDVEIIAAGISGYNTKQELDNILRNDNIMEEVDPDLIIVAYVENDIQFRDENDTDLLLTLIEEDIYFYSNNKLTNFLQKLWPELYHKVNLQISNKYKFEEWFNKKFGYQYNSWTLALTNDPWKTKYEEEVLTDVVSYINNESPCPLFFIPVSAFPNYSLEHKFIVDEFEKFDIPYYSAMFEFIAELPAIHGYSFEEWGINPANGHPAVKTNLFYAKYLYNVLTTDYSDIVQKVNYFMPSYFEINDWLPYSLNTTALDYDYYKITYPAKNSTDSFLSLPINKDYVKLNLKFPMNIKSIEITGDNIKSIELYTNSINPDLGYDDQVMKSIGEKKDVFVWNLEDVKDITSINISAKVIGGDSTDMYIKFDY